MKFYLGWAQQEMAYPYVGPNRIDYCFRDFFCDFWQEIRPSAYQFLNGFGCGFERDTEYSGASGYFVYFTREGSSDRVLVDQRQTGYFENYFLIKQALRYENGRIVPGRYTVYGSIGGGASNLGNYLWLDVRPKDNPDNPDYFEARWGHQYIGQPPIEKSEDYWLGWGYSYWGIPETPRFRVEEQGSYGAGSSAGIFCIDARRSKDLKPTDQILWTVTFYPEQGGPEGVGQHVGNWRNQGFTNWIHGFYGYFFPGAYDISCTVNGVPAKNKLYYAVVGEGAYSNVVWGSDVEIVPVLFWTDHVNTKEVP